MKKLAAGIICVFALTQVSLAQEIVTNSMGEEIVLLSDGKWIPRERYDRNMEFESMIDVEILRVNPKRNRYRTITLQVRNNSREELSYAALGIKFRFGEEYSLRKIISVNNLKPGDSVDIQRQISVQDIEGRDILVEVIDFSF